MKTLKILFITISIMTTGLIVISCGSKSGHSHEMQGKEYTSVYVCPMHCDGSGSSIAGTCPVCGMDYVALTDHSSDGHKHEDHNHHGQNGDVHDHDGEDHDGHENGDHDGHNH